MLFVSYFGCFDTYRSFEFRVKFRISLSGFTNKPARILNKIVMNLQINFGRTGILAVLSLLIHKYDLSFHLLRSLNFSSSDTVYKFSTSFVNFIFIYFVVFDAIGNTIFKISIFFFFFLVRIQQLSFEYLTCILKPYSTHLLMLTFF